MAKKKKSSVIPIDRDKDHLDAALKDITKKFGEGTLMKLNDESRARGVEAISTGSLNLDLASGVGGVPRGRVVEIYGPESSGKTTLALQIIANAQKGGGTAAFIDAEHSLDPVYSRKLGVDIDELLVSQPNCGEDALEITNLLVSSNAVDVIVIDSVAALVPRSELEGQMGDSQMGVQARLMSQAMRKLTGIISRTRCCVIFINQIRMKIGVMFGSPETTTGGNALKFYASMRLDVRRVQTLRDKEDIIGNKVRVKVAKNKVAAPFKRAEFEILFNSGISREGEILDLGESMKLLKKAGAWYSWGETKLGNGRETARAFLVDNPDIADEIADAIQVKLLGEAIESDDPAESSDEESLTKAS